MKFIGNTCPFGKPVPDGFADLWQQLSMDSDSKWGHVQPASASEWSWGPVDRAYQYAKAHGIPFKQHNFFCRNQQPAWVNERNVATVGPAWIEAFGKRYPDTALIDVVNEPLPDHNPPLYTKGMGGTGGTGYDWIVTAFAWARQYCPGAILLVNDYNIIEREEDCNWFVTMMQRLLATGAQIDAIGAQGHDVYKIGTAKAKVYLNRIASLGLPIYITEFEVDLEDDNEQLRCMQEAISMFYEHPAVKGITCWGYIEGMMWNQRPNGWLVDSHGKRRPAMDWLQDFIRKNTP